jgi:hypothetical protein
VYDQLPMHSARQRRNYWKTTSNIIQKECLHYHNTTYCRSCCLYFITYYSQLYYFWCEKWKSIVKCNNNDWIPTRKAALGFQTWSILISRKFMYVYASHDQRHYARVCCLKYGGSFKRSYVGQQSELNNLAWYIIFNITRNIIESTCNLQK